MAEQWLSQNYFVGTGSRTTWEYSFAGARPDNPNGGPYLSTDDIRVALVDRDEVGVEIRTPVPFTLLGSNQVIISPAIAEGQEFVIYRETELESTLVDYTDFTAVSERDLDISYRQNLYTNQELRDYSKGSRVLAEEARRDTAAALDVISEIVGSEETLAELVRRHEITDAESFSHLARVNTSTGTQQPIGESLDRRGIRFLALRAPTSGIFDPEAYLETSTKIQEGAFCHTLGYYTPGDGGGYDYEIVAAGTGADDGGSSINLTGSGLKAKATFIHFVPVECFGIKPDGVLSNNSARLQAAIDSGFNKFLGYGRHYRFEASVFVDPLSEFTFVGAGAINTKITASQGVVPFRSNWVFPVAFINKVKLKDVTFDGEYDRTYGDFDYRSTSGKTYGLHTAINMTADLNSKDSVFELENVVFNRCIGLPIFVTGYRTVKLTNVDTLLSRDIGIINCQDVEINGGRSVFGSDASISASRGCKRLVVNGRLIKDCTTGVLARGFDIDNTGTLTLTGTSWAFRDTVTITRSSGAFTTPDLGQNIIITSGADSATLKVLEITGLTTATAQVMGSLVPVALRNTPVSWKSGPTKGPEDVSIDATVVGSYSNDFDLREGSDRVRIRGMSIRCGRYADSASEQVCDIRRATAVAYIEDSSIYPVGTYVLIEDLNNYARYHVASVASVDSATQITISSNSPNSFINGRIYVLQQKVGGVPVAQISANSDLLDAVDLVDINLTIYDNVSTNVFEITDARSVSINGSTNKNKFPVGQPSTRRFMRLREENHEIENLLVNSNLYADANTTFVRIEQRDSNVRPVTIAYNRVRSDVALIQALDYVTPATVTSSYTVDAAGNINT